MNFVAIYYKIVVPIMCASGNIYWLSKIHKILLYPFIKYFFENFVNVEFNFVLYVNNNIFLNFLQISLSKLSKIFYDYKRKSP